MLAHRDDLGLQFFARGVGKSAGGTQQTAEEQNRKDPGHEIIYVASADDVEGAQEKAFCALPRRSMSTRPTVRLLAQEHLLGQSALFSPLTNCLVEVRKVML